MYVASHGCACVCVAGEHVRVLMQSALLCAVPLSVYRAGDKAPRSAEDGAATIVHIALTERSNNKSGAFWEDRHMATGLGETVTTHQ